MVPNDDERKAYREFDAARKDVNELTEEDKVRMLNYNYSDVRPPKYHALLYN